MHKAAARHKIDFDGQFDWVLRTKRTPAPENDAVRADDACRARVTERGPWVQGSIGFKAMLKSPSKQQFDYDI